MNVESRVADHYSNGQLLHAILAALPAAGKDPARLMPRDLAPLDEFHVCGLEAAEALGKALELRPGLHLLDVGSGIGGPARLFAAEYRCRVTGIDLTEEFVAVARRLTEMTKLAATVEFQHASALAPPFPPASFDRAVMIHVGMNVDDKPRLFRAVRRLLKPQALFAIFDLMRTGDGDLRYPVPWAASEDASFVAIPAAYRAALEAAGFNVLRETDRRAEAIEFTKRMMAARAAQGSPALGLHLLMGERTPVMVQNMLAMLEANQLAPIELLAQVA